MKHAPVIVVQLVHILGPLKGEIQEFSRPVISIGRLPSCQVCFPADLTSISRNHAEIIREGNQFKLVDHSTNGTLVNGKRVKEVYLKNGDVLAFSEGGPKVSFLTQMKEGQVEPERTIPPHPREESQPSLNRDIPVAHQEPKKGEPKPGRPEEISVQNVKVPLVIQYGPTLRSFKELPVTVGKSLKCGFTLEHPAILDQHAQIFFSQNQYWVKDLTGQSLVQINRQPIPFQAPLNLNDDLALSPQGPVFRFLGEGRLAEVEQPSVKESSDSHEKKGEGTPETKDSKKGPSVLKKFFRR